MQKSNIVMVALLCAALFCCSPLLVAQSDVSYSAQLTTAYTQADNNCPATACLTVTSANYGSVGIGVSGTYAGSTLVFEYTPDGGRTWDLRNCSRGDTPLQESSEALPSNQSRAWNCGAYATTNFRVRQSAIGSGAPNIVLLLSGKPIEPAPAPAGGTAGTPAGPVLTVQPPAGSTGTPFNIVQNVVRDTNNTTTAQLASSATFTGTYTSTLGISSYQVNIVTDQPGTLIVDQCKNANCSSPDLSSPSITVPASVANSPLMALTFQMTSENVRIRFTNNGGSTTTTLAITSELCPLCVFQTAFPPITSSAFLGNSLNVGVPMMEKGSRWPGVVSSPAAGSQATASKAAGGAGVRHVADCVSVSAGASTAPTATVLTINLRDGATGAGTVLWSTQIAAANTAAQHGSVHLCGLNQIGTANTAMTLEFAASLANESESVTLIGYDVH
ncbi:MAG TPA: hypothetical protein VKY85_07565 [Candidatus Angelobacter sp.]|nr:hypothetical protein [Candidatus Angelobacter sp.]